MKFKCSEIDNNGSLEQLEIPITRFCEICHDVIEEEWRMHSIKIPDRRAGFTVCGDCMLYLKRHFNKTNNRG